MLVVNLFGQPGASKSTLTAYIFSKLKMEGINAEMALEFAKEKCWEESVEVFNNQAYIFGKQYFRLSRLKDKVDVVITDSPILLSVFYNDREKHPELGDNFEGMCLDVFHSFDNYNVFINRVKPYNPKGRFQTEEESDALVNPMKEMLNKMEITCKEYDGNIEGGDKIVEDILHILNVRKKMESMPRQLDPVEIDTKI